MIEWKHIQNYFTYCPKIHLPIRNDGEHDYEFNS